ncbi:hypothetical protein BWQ96_05329 [Gracilariopsis chorda]|uniref:Uncharacterized protein n=1 Tax=Gracilariopsis chorda TaxID=448386 RepID=A0A2V3IS15_9FLOR|nr:hypothetical protein BWQ96_05329 [Gracilariopsis chorda]|eukprot:PXF44909.1 hypothetical protein BWQ96_05329 [Gracilariopsis chorda]
MFKWKNGISFWDESHGLKDASKSHLKILFSTSLPAVKVLCQRANEKAVTLSLSNCFKNERGISNSLRDILSTSKRLESLALPKDLENVRTEFSALANMSEGMRSYLLQSAEMSYTTQRSIYRFKQKVHRKLKMLEFKIIWHIGELEKQIKSLDVSYSDLGALLTSLRPYSVKEDGRAVHVLLRKALHEARMNSRASRITYYHWLVSRGLAPERCHRTKNSMTMCDGIVRSVSQTGNKKQTSCGTCGDHMVRLTMQAYATFADMIGTWLACNVLAATKTCVRISFREWLSGLRTKVGMDLECTLRNCHLLSVTNAVLVTLCMILVWRSVRDGRNLLSGPKVDHLCLVIERELRNNNEELRSKRVELQNLRISGRAEAICDTSAEMCRLAELCLKRCRDMEVAYQKVVTENQKRCRRGAGAKKERVGRSGIGT